VHREILQFGLVVGFLFVTFLFVTAITLYGDLNINLNQTWQAA
jgi:hypothetical protein